MYLLVKEDKKYVKKTLNSSLPIFQSRPKIIAAIDIEKNKNEPTLHLLKQQGIIVYARGGQIELHDTKEPYAKIQTLELDIEERDDVEEHVRNLSDETRIGNTPWEKMKEEAMKDKYDETDWFFSLNATQAHLIKALRTA